MSAPVVSSTQSYKELCLAGKNEERRLAELCKRMQYHSTPNPPLNKKDDNPAERQEQGGKRQAANSNQQLW